MGTQISVGKGGSLINLQSLATFGTTTVENWEIGQAQVNNLNDAEPGIIEFSGPDPVVLDDPTIIEGFGLGVFNPTSVSIGE